MNVVFLCSIERNRKIAKEVCVYARAMNEVMDIIIKKFFHLTYRVVNQGDVIRQSSMSINATVQIPQIKMTKVHIPFTFRLETQKDSDEGEQTYLINNIGSYSRD